ARASTGLGAVCQFVNRPCTIGRDGASEANREERPQHRGGVVPQPLDLAVLPSSRRGSENAMSRARRPSTPWRELPVALTDVSGFRPSLRRDPALSSLRQLLFGVKLGGN